MNHDSTANADSSANRQERLAAQLRHRSNQVRVQAAYAIALLPSISHRTELSLKNSILNDPDPEARAAAMYAVARLVPLDTEILKFAESQLADTESEIALFSAYALSSSVGNRGQDWTAIANAGIATLIGALGDNDGTFVVRLASAVAGLGAPHDLRAVLRLAPILITSDDPRRANVQHALNAIGKGSPSVAKALISDPRLAPAHVRAIGHLGVGDPLVVRFLMQCAEKREPSHAVACVKALGDLGPAARVSEDLLARTMLEGPASLQLPAGLSLLSVAPDRLDSTLSDLRKTEPDLAEELTLRRNLGRLD